MQTLMLQQQQQLWAHPEASNSATRPATRTRAQPKLSVSNAAGGALVANVSMELHLFVNSQVTVAE